MFYDKTHKTKIKQKKEGQPLNFQKNYGIADLTHLSRCVVNKRKQIEEATTTTNRREREDSHLSILIKLLLIRTQLCRCSSVSGFSDFSQL